MTAFKRLATISLTLVLLILAATLPVSAQDGVKISRLGEYSGYSTPKYTEWVRTSQYVPVRDGTRLAVDVVRPAVNGVPVAEKLPVLLIFERYHRARFVDGKPVTQARFIQFWSYWLSYGYVIATADMRGTGASFGHRIGELIDDDSRDAYDIIQWLAAQPWSNGKVGMMGVSAQGNSQFLAAGGAPPALKAIVPQMAMFDVYSFAYPGGVFRYEFLKAWSESIYRLDNNTPPVPVDEDTDGSLAAAAVREHAQNVGVYESSRGAPYRDSIYQPANIHPYFDLSLSRLVDGINTSDVAVYLIGGWYDMWPRDAAAWFNNLTRPRRVIFTPFSHGAGFDQGWYGFIGGLIDDDFNLLAAFNFQVAEHLRFFDYHLKGIDNGIMDELPVWYYVMGAPAGQAWRSATQWPLPEEQRTKFYLQGGPSGSIASVNDGRLGMEQPPTSGDADQYTVDYTTTTGQNTRWHNGHGVRFNYDDMAAQGEKSLTYTTDPLTEAVEMTGHPIVSLWVRSSTSGGDFFVYLEEVDENGYATYLTEGVLRASHRALNDPPYRYMNLPWHRSFVADVEPIPAGEYANLVFDLHPTSNIFDAGHRIRVRITGADVDSYLTLKRDPAPVYTIARNAQRPSYVELPIIPAR